MFVQDMLEELGHEVTEVAERLETAELHASSAEIDLAILDLDLDGRRTTNVATTLAARGVPFIVASGHHVTEDWPLAPTLPKPFVLRDLELSIAEAMSGSAR